MKTNVIFDASIKLHIVLLRLFSIAATTTMSFLYATNIYYYSIQYQNNEED